MNYYNEWDTNAAAWIRQLITDGIIPKGHVDERSITEVTPSDLRGYTQAHFFAGLAGWPLALKLAGWPEDRPVWTASLPCQSFSSAGKQRGTDDERHLWPVFERLVRECRPPVCFGEQVASKLARTDWLPGVCMDLQNLGYSATAVDICAPCAGEVGEGRIVRGDQETWEPIILGAPHIRQRLYWVACRMADTDSERHHGIDPLLRRDESGRDAEDIPQAARGGATSGMADTQSSGGVERISGKCDGSETTDEGSRRHEDRQLDEPGTDSNSGGMADTPSDRQQRGGQATEAQEGREQGRDVGGELPGGSEGRALHGGVADPNGEQRQQGLQPHEGGETERIGGSGEPEWLGDSHSERREEHGRPSQLHLEQRQGADTNGLGFDSGVLGYSTCVGLQCADGKARRFEPGIFPLAHGLPRGVVPSGDPSEQSYANATGEARVMRLKGYGNAINAPLAAMFISTCMEVIPHE